MHCKDTLVFTVIKKRLSPRRVCTHPHAKFAHPVVTPEANMAYPAVMAGMGYSPVAGTLST